MLFTVFVLRKEPATDQPSADTASSASQCQIRVAGKGFKKLKEEGLAQIINIDTRQLIAIVFPLRLSQLNTARGAKVCSHHLVKGTREYSKRICKTVHSLTELMLD